MIAEFDARYDITHGWLVTQVFFQKIFLLIGLICIPWMLLAKPIHIMREQKRQRELVGVSGNENELVEAIFGHSAVAYAIVCRR